MPRRNEITMARDAMVISWPCRMGECDCFILVKITGTMLLGLEMMYWRVQRSDSCEMYRSIFEMRFSRNKMILCIGSVR